MEEKGRKKNNGSNPCRSAPPPPLRHHAVLAILLATVEVPSSGALDLAPAAPRLRLHLMREEGPHRTGERAGEAPAATQGRGRGAGHHEGEGIGAGQLHKGEEEAPT